VLRPSYNITAVEKSGDGYNLMKGKEMLEKVPKNPIVIGYFRLRGRAQVPRLILEYLSLNYKDHIF
jgi:hypothetical protein